MRKIVMDTCLAASLVLMKPLRLPNDGESQCCTEKPFQEVRKDWR